VRVVAGTTRALPGRCRWAEQLARQARQDLGVLDIGVHGPGALVGADVVVADCPDLTGCSPAAAAIDAGIPVIAVTTDSAVELLGARHAQGSVVPPEPDAVVRAVLAHLDLVPARPQTPATPATPVTAGVEDLARRLFRIYQHALAWSWRAAS
jgi:hypothetical protein